MMEQKIADATTATQSRMIRFQQKMDDNATTFAVVCLTVKTDSESERPLASMASLFRSKMEEILFPVEGKVEGKIVIRHGIEVGYIATIDRDNTPRLTIRSEFKDNNRSWNQDKVYLSIDRMRDECYHRKNEIKFLNDKLVDAVREFSDESDEKTQEEFFEELKLTKKMIRNHEEEIARIQSQIPTTFSYELTDSTTTVSVGPNEHSPFFEVMRGVFYSVCFHMEPRVADQGIARPTVTTQTRVDGI